VWKKKRKKGKEKERNSGKKAPGFKTGFQENSRGALFFPEASFPPPFLALSAWALLCGGSREKEPGIGGIGLSTGSPPRGVP